MYKLIQDSELKFRICTKNTWRRNLKKNKYGKPTGKNGFYGLLECSSGK